MSCVLRVSGTSLDIDRVLRALPVQPYRIWRLGEPMSPRSVRSKTHETSGACFQVSSAEMDQFAQQQADALRFLEAHQVWLKELRENPSVEDTRLDFGVERGEAWMQSLVLSPEFLAAASKARVSVELSSYSSSHES